MTRPLPRSMTTWKLYAHLRNDHGLAPEALAAARTMTALRDIHEATAPGCQGGES